MVFSTGEPARFESGSALGGDDSWEDTRLVPLRAGGDGAVQAVLGITPGTSRTKQTSKTSSGPQARKLPDGDLHKAGGQDCVCQPLYDTVPWLYREELKKRT